MSATDRQAAYIFLHGSGDRPSTGGLGADLSEWLRSKYAIDLVQPDLNQPDMTHLTVSAALQHVKDVALTSPATHYHLIGYSLGGYVAALLASMYPQQIASVALIAPAADPLKAFADMGIDLQQWKLHRYMLSYFHGGRVHFAYTDRPEPRTGQLPDDVGHIEVLAHDFVEDLVKHAQPPIVACPTLMLCGTQDVQITLASCQRYMQLLKDNGNTNVSLVAFNDSHQLVRPESLEPIKAQLQHFFQLSATIS